MQTVSSLLQRLPEILPHCSIHHHSDVADVVGRKATFVELFPGSTADAIQLNEFLRATGSKFHTVSTGKNWGLGSNFPPPDVNIVVNLSRLDQIVQFNRELGYVEIQPGVTQEKLSRFLAEQNSEWYIDVTGSGAATSILGNALARGISYNYFRVDRVMKLKVLLKDGRIDETGFKGDLPICHLYRWGLGPDTSGLYFQSNLGMVLAGTIKLDRRPDSLETFSINFDPRNLSQVCEAIEDLQQQEVIRCNIHLANSGRYMPVLIANLMTRAGLNEAEARRFIARVIKTDQWMGSGVIFGNRLLVAARKRAIRKRLKGIARPQFMSHGKLSLLRALFKWSPKFTALFNTVSELRGFAMGIPSDVAVTSLATSGSLDHYVQNKSVDTGDWGAVFYSPVGPYLGPEIEAAIRRTVDLAQAFQFVPAITVNSPGNQVAEYVISLHYPKTAENTARALECLEAIRTGLEQAGILPYRLGIWQEGAVSSLKLPGL